MCVFVRRWLWGLGKDRLACRWWDELDEEASLKSCCLVLQIACCTPPCPVVPAPAQLSSASNPGDSDLSCPYLCLAHPSLPPACLPASATAPLCLRAFAHAVLPLRSRVPATRSPLLLSSSFSPSVLYFEWQEESSELSYALAQVHPLFTFCFISLTLWIFGAS